MEKIRDFKKRRRMMEHIGDVDSLWLKRELTELLDWLFAICDFVKREPSLKGRLKTRLNTNGLSVVGFSISPQDIEDCRRIAQKLGIKFRVR